MKKFALVLIPLVLFICFIWCMDYFFFGMKYLPKGEFMETVYSPNENYKINSYLVNAGATVDFSVRCEVVNACTGEKRNLFWEYHCEKANIEWIDDDNVKINGKKLNIHSDTYDWRNK